MVDVAVTKNNTKQKKTSAMTAWADVPIPGLNILSAIVLWIVMTTIAPLVLLVESVPNLLGLTLLLFNNINLIVAFCEIVLGNHIMFIKQHYLQLKKEYSEGGRERYAFVTFMFQPLTLSTLLLDGHEWAKMWSTYSLWDPSYQNHESFGFFIDVGNGYSTIPPCVLWNLVILFPKLFEPYPSAYLWVGIIGCCSYWQVIYGTIIYIFSFIFNKRYQGRPLGEVLGFVGVANGIWFVFPLWAMYASVVMLRDQTVMIFR